MVAGLADGTGGASFYKSLAQTKTPQDFLDRAAKTDRSQAARLVQDLRCYWLPLASGQPNRQAMSAGYCT